MRIIGVIDLSNGRAVHAHGGARDRYRPIARILDEAIAPGDAEAVARMYIERFGLSELYVADLDAIAGRPSQDAVVRSIAACGAALWLDAGIASPAAAHHAWDNGASHAVVGLETLPSFSALEAICAAAARPSAFAATGGAVAFSLDLRNGAAVGSGCTMAADEAPEHLAVRAAAAGVGTVIVIDLARVGSRSGFDLPLLARVRRATTGSTLIAGGGLRGPDDCRRLQDVGCDGVLVATALHEGRLRPGRTSPANLWR